MDFDGAIQADTNWKLKLFNYSRGKLTGKVDRQALRTLGNDKLCALGQWLYGGGRRYSPEPQFQKLLEAHSAFHASAAAIGAMVEGGRASEAEKLLNSPQSDFNRLSFRVIGILLDFPLKQLAARSSSRQADRPNRRATDRRP